MKRKKRTPEERAADAARSAEVMRRLQERIAYHEAILARERERRGPQTGH